MAPRRALGTIAAATAFACATTAFGATTRPAAPSATEFAHQFVTLANAFALSQGYRIRVVHPDCIEASPRHYMCAYATRRPGSGDQCRLMQAKWTPNAPSPITITLAGRVAVCSSLREALASLQAPPAA
jgi:hypothetical protein